ncbi:hypothetical protein ACU610_21375 [Geodermatophilus sp. URMC 61]|uniref:hypothetical protein n=1 Tax=Geodermatophilus sp. URMC 61 TaxID=3423411 RepID=UPI00406CABB6
MESDDDRGRVLRGKLRESRVEITLGAPVIEHGDYVHRGVAAWHGEALVDVDPELDTQPVWARADVALARRPIPGADGSEFLTIARGYGLLIDLDIAGDLATALDQNGDHAHFLPLFFDTGEFGLHADFDELVDGIGSRVVLLDRALLAREWRGLGGAGRLLIARMLQWLMPGAMLVVTQPAPFELSNSVDNTTYAAGLQQVRGVWRSLGFTHWRDDIWYMDPARSEFDDAVAHLEDGLVLPKEQ